MFGSFMPQFGSRSKASSISSGGGDQQGPQQQFGPNPNMPPWAASFGRAFGQPRQGMPDDSMGRQQPQMGMGGFGGMRSAMPSPQTFMGMMGQQQGPMPQASAMGQQHANPNSAIGRMAGGLFRGFDPSSSGSSGFGAAEQRGMPMQPPMQFNNPGMGMRPGDLGNSGGPIADMYGSGQIQTMRGPMQGGLRFA